MPKKEEKMDGIDLLLYYAKKIEEKAKRTAHLGPEPFYWSNLINCRPPFPQYYSPLNFRGNEFYDHRANSPQTQTRANLNNFFIQNPVVGHNRPPRTDQEGNSSTGNNLKRRKVIRKNAADELIAQCEYEEWLKHKDLTDNQRKEHFRNGNYEIGRFYGSYGPERQIFPQFDMRNSPIYQKFYAAQQGKNLRKSPENDSRSKNKRAGKPRRLPKDDSFYDSMKEMITKKPKKKRQPKKVVKGKK